ncbi:circadian clock protein LdpA [Planktothrix agardhii]|uniref:LdpA n=2 Tax=Planktothrix agardhii TaxID=1160 RepID=A0A073CBY3_PLAA1|nr:LdpA C-terminal domain-containing domain [Planktothrix agardhii]MCF3608421.1 4Fe-4S binding protein [Planktothrix agardhii 1033]BBD54541.1 Fe-S cluster containing protein [Planktothrix agardhii NIES-204]KEI65626.1 LdpA [Planktothrix agardhii NIVA-CYA 126/8]MBG0746548.1 4Fe-4S binding protein [Planktothrix agardhii KL2]MCB8752541.1 4Fe-4S binding protein [Planktothrix agardhii 1810]
MNNYDSPLTALQQGNWFKLICGASYQHLPAIRNLTLAYTLAGADCIDVAADPAVITVAQEALNRAEFLGEQAQTLGFGYRYRPWLMVSLNDGEDPHFRKAQFEATVCPESCWRPCETVCPTGAIAFSPLKSGVIDELCYGCGRCISICPVDLIDARSYVFRPDQIAPLVLQTGIDALEIHTQVGREKDFQRLWNSIQPYLEKLKLVAISCPDGEGVVNYLKTLSEMILPLNCPLIWQTDGRPMSGDIGAGTTLASVKLCQKILAANLPGYVQLAGGTNDYTVAKLKSLGLLQSTVIDDPVLNPVFPNPDQQTQTIGGKQLRSVNYGHRVAGVGYGSYARVLLSPLLEQLESRSTTEPQRDSFQRQETFIEGSQPLSQKKTLSSVETRPSLSVLEANPELLWQVVGKASTLVSQIKSVIGDH